jgi:predicted transcriptional regulator
MVVTSVRSHTPRKSLTLLLLLLLPILQMIGSRVILSDIARTLNLPKSHVSYYIHRPRDLGPIKESPRSAFKILKLTKAGNDFLAMYTNSSSKWPYLNYVALSAPIMAKTTLEER